MEEVQLPFQSDRFKEAWGEWLLYRKQRKLRNYVPIGLKKTFTKLKSDAENDEEMAIKMIENAMSCAWSGIFPLKKSYNNGSYQQNSGSFGYVTKRSYGGETPL